MVIKSRYQQLEDIGLEYNPITSNYIGTINTKLIVVNEQDIKSKSNEDWDKLLQEIETIHNIKKFDEDESYFKSKFGK